MSGEALVSPRPEFKVGEVWRTRSGLTATITTGERSVPGAVFAMVIPHGDLEYRADGSWAEGMEHDLDLVTLVEHVSEPTGATLTVSEGSVPDRAAIASRIFCALVGRLWTDMEPRPAMYASRAVEWADLLIAALAKPVAEDVP